MFQVIRVDPEKAIQIAEGTATEYWDGGKKRNEGWNFACNDDINIKFFDGSLRDAE